jgi:hypothetical protein
MSAFFFTHFFTLQPFSLRLVAARTACIASHGNARYRRDALGEQR